MLQARRILLSGLVALLMVGMVNADETGVSADSGSQTERLPFFGAYVGNWTVVDGVRQCTDSTYWKCFRLIIDFNIPW